jgi:DNA-binding CsgD family transcriptional regulator
MNEEEYIKQLKEEGYSNKQIFDILAENQYWKDVMDNL